MQVKIDVQKVELLKNGNYKVKIRETNVNLTTMNHQGKVYKTLRALGRGRFIMKIIGEVIIQRGPENMVVVEGKKYMGGGVCQEI